MAKKSARRARTVDLDVVAFMSEFARYLLEAGMTSSQFADLARVGFYEAASTNAKFPNMRVNQSAVAALTGLSRTEVRALANRGKAPPAVKASHIDAIVEGWSADVRFTGSDYAPRRLSLAGRSSGFSRLVDKYGGDVPAKSMLRALQRRGYVTVRGGYAHLHPSARLARGMSRLQHISRTLIALLRSSESGIEALSPIRTLTMEVAHPAASAKGRIVAQKRAVKSIQALMADLHAAGVAASIESPPSAAQRAWVTRVRVALIAEDSAA